MENRAVRLQIFVDALSEGIEDWRAQYIKVTAPVLNAEDFLAQTPMRNFSSADILEADPTETLSDPDDIERRYNFTNFSITVRKAKLLQSILALESTLQIKHSGPDLVDLLGGRAITQARITKFFQHAASLKEDPFNDMDYQQIVHYEGFDPKITMDMYDDVRTHIRDMKDPFKFAKITNALKGNILDEIYELRVEYAGQCAEQISLNMSYAQTLLMISAAGKLLVSHDKIPEFHPTLAYIDLYPALGKDFMDNAEDNVRLVLSFLGQVDSMTEHNPDPEAAVKVKRYVAIDPDFGLR